MMRLLVCLMFVLVGCDGGISIGLNNKIYYPDQIGSMKYGDPRKVTVEKVDVVEPVEDLTPEPVATKFGFVGYQGLK